MAVVLANNAHSTLVSAISSVDTSLTVADAEFFPVLNSGEYFYCTLENTSGAYEIIKVTQVAGSVFTVERAQESTIAIPFVASSRIELRVTVQSLDDYFSDISDTIVGDLLDGADFTGDITVPDEAYGVAWNASTEVPTKNALYDKIDSIDVLITAMGTVVQLKGTWDASAGTFPGAGAAQAGWSYIVSVSGTVDSVSFVAGDRLIAIANNASTTVYASNWFKADYTDLVSSVAGKTGAVTLQVADITDMSANGRSLVAATYADMRTQLDLEPNVDFVPLSGGTYSGDVSVPDEAYGVAWNGSVEVPTKNAVYDQMETKLASASYTAADVLSKLLTVDGSGSGLDADLLDGTSSAGFATSGANTNITSVYLNNTGLKIKDTDASHGLSIVPGSDLAADRTLTFTTGDASRTVTLSGDLTVGTTSSISGTAYVSGGTDVAVADGGTGASTADGAITNLGAMKQGLTTIPVLAAAMQVATTNGASVAAIETTTNKILYRTLDFDQTTQEFAGFTIPMPKSYNDSTVTFQPIWTASAGTGTVEWALQGVALSNDDAVDTAYGTEQVSTDTLIATDDVHIGPTSSAITIAGTPAADDMIFFRIKRNVANDTLTGDARLIGIRLYFTTNASDDT